jgi:hypothetical protein
MAASGVFVEAGIARILPYRAMFPGIVVKFQYTNQLNSPVRKSIGGEMVTAAGFETFKQ